MADDDIQDIREAFEAAAWAALAERGPAPVKVRPTRDGFLRTVIVVDKSGKAIGRKTIADVLNSEFAKQNLAAESHGKRPPWAKCPELGCNEWFRLYRAGELQIFCERCKRIRARESERERKRRNRAKDPDKTRADARAAQKRKREADPSGTRASVRERVRKHRARRKAASESQR